LSNINVRADVQQIY